MDYIQQEAQTSLSVMLLLSNYIHLGTLRDALLILQAVVLLSRIGLTVAHVPQ